jgi:hypothetical protein
MVESSSGAEVKFPEMGAGFPPVISRGIFSGLCHFLGKWLWDRIFILNFADISRKFASDPRIFPPENEEISTPPPC